MQHFITKSGRHDVGGLMEAYNRSRGRLMDAMLANIGEHPLTGIGFGIASDPWHMNVRTDAVFGLPVGASIEKGVTPLMVLEELGVFGAALVALWVVALLRGCARGGLAPLAICLTALLLNMGEATLFSPGGFGLLLLVLLGWAYASGQPTNTAANMAEPVWFWQRIVSPHMAGLAEALAAQGRQVTYVAERQMSADRAAQGWRPPGLDMAQLRFAPDAETVTKLVAGVPRDSIHICQGFRGNGLVGLAQRALSGRGLRQWVIMETVDDSGWRGALKRLEYRRLVHRWHGRIAGILAIGHATPGWLAARGAPSELIFPFAYFLPDSEMRSTPAFSATAPFRVLFVGRLIQRKRLDILFDALARIDEFSFELAVIGSGPLEPELRAQAQTRLGKRIAWLGQRAIEEIPGFMAEADCLVLPSRFDGWGAVVSEALMAGTPAICSDRCGSATAARASGCGGVFAAGNAEALEKLIGSAMAQGRQTPDRRAALVAWARCLGATAGSEYLAAILRHVPGKKSRPQPPWTPRLSSVQYHEDGQPEWASR